MAGASLNASVLSVAQSGSVQDDALELVPKEELLVIYKDLCKQYLDVSVKQRLAERLLGQVEDVGTSSEAEQSLQDILAEAQECEAQRDEAIKAALWRYKPTAAQTAALETRERLEELRQARRDYDALFKDSPVVPVEELLRREKEPPKAADSKRAALKDANDRLQKQTASLVEEAAAVAAGRAKQPAKSPAKEERKQSERGLLLLRSTGDWTDLRLQGNLLTAEWKSGSVKLRVSGAGGSTVESVEAVKGRAEEKVAAWASTLALPAPAFAVLTDVADKLL